MKITQIKVKDILPLDYKKISKEKHLSKAKGIFKNEDIYALCVYNENDDFIGLTTERNLAERGVPAHTKIKSLIYDPPKISPDDALIDAAKKVLDSGYDAAPIFDKGKVIGVLTEYNMIDIARKADELSGEKSEKYADEVISIEVEEDIGKARHIMHEEGVSRLPVVDNENKLMGVVTLKEIMKTIQPNERMGERDVAGEKIPHYEIPISSIMNDKSLTIDEETDLKTAAEQMNKKKQYSAIIVKNKKPLGIITPKDIIEFIASLKQKRGVYLQITGMPDVDNFVVSKLHDTVDKTVQKIGRIYEGLEYLIIHIKEHNKGGKQTKYSIRTRFMTPVGIFVSKDWDWDLITALDKALDNLERQVINDHEKRKDRRKK
ncbi:MAG: CBS domain-containing protein [Candidatus Aenigmatarchaeota archaeon]